MIRESRLVGQQSVWTATFTDPVTGLPIDPTTVTFRWKLRSTTGPGNPFTFPADNEIVRRSAGVYDFTAPPYVDPETHLVRVTSTGLVAAAADESVKVVATAFASVGP